MSRRIRFACTAGSLMFAVALVLGPGTAGASAGTRHKHHLATARQSHRSYAAPREDRSAYRYPPEWGFETGVPANAIRGPGYVFVPGKGILGEPCDMPTSTCTNEYRDVQ